jgi:23S rRNA (cytosine1962-C5)-methyltransferase
MNIWKSCAGQVTTGLKNSDNLFNYTINVSYKKVYLKPGKEESLKRFHPWVFSGAIARVEGEPEEGEVVDVYTSQKEFIACGHFQVGSIAVRVLSFRQETIDHAFWVRRLEVAKDLRRALGLIGNPQNNTYRLVHGEGDNLPGLIIDVYDHTAVMQAHSAGIHVYRMEIADALSEVMGDVIQNIYYKSETTLPFKADLLATENGFIKGGSPENIAMENGLKFHVDWLKGQKTGFFVDQRENRHLLEHYAKGRNVLNMFCYTGGFSFYAMRGGANLVHSVDSSAKAIDLTNENVELNFPGDARHQAFAEDAFKFLDRMGDQYDLIILDPPAFAKHRDALRNALRGYTKLNAKAFEKIRPGGILFTFSCSQVVNKQDFRNAVFTAAAQSGRSVRILHQLTQPGDHPVNIYHPEGEYLKGLVLYVE